MSFAPRNFPGSDLYHDVNAVVPRYYAMFAPLAPIRSDSQSAAAIDSVLARIDAIGTVLHGLGHMAGQPSVAASGSLDQCALLSARLAERDADAMAHIACELDAIAASLQAGFAALDRARKGGHRAVAAAAFLHREANEHLAATLWDRAPFGRLT